MTDDRYAAFANPLALWEPMMQFWAGAMMAATGESIKFWNFPFNPPAPDEREVEGDLDIPGPLERDFEHNLHA